MRKMISLTALAVTAFATAAMAQQALPEPSPASPEIQSPTSATPNAAAPMIQSVNVVELEQLPQETQKELNDRVAEGGEAGLKQLQGSVEAMPQAATALSEKGLTSKDVIVASISQDGVLTLVTTKKAS